MRPLLLAVTAFVLASCRPDLPARTAALEADTAAARGETWHALRLYRVAASQGDLDALQTLANAYQQGYVRANTGSPARHFPFLTLPGQGQRWRARYEQARDDRARSGDPAALLRMADDLTHWNPDATDADRDSARAIRQRLVDADYPPALLARALSIRDDESSRDQMLRRAEAAGSAQACYLRVLFRHSRMVTAAETAAYIDDNEACPPIPGEHPTPGEWIVRNLLDGQNRGEAWATAHLDSLRALGVFERHPQLAAVLDDVSDV